MSWYEAADECAKRQSVLFQPAEFSHYIHFIYRALEHVTNYGTPPREIFLLRLPPFMKVTSTIIPNA
jgi:hypothetical protein